MRSDTEQEGTYMAHASTAAATATPAHEPRIRETGQRAVYQIESRTHRGRFYTVDLGRMTCDCPAGLHGRHCWHQDAGMDYYERAFLEELRLAAHRPRGMA